VTGGDGLPEETPDAIDGIGDEIAEGVPVPRVVLLGKPGCHLCETARDVVSAVTAELGVDWQELSILDDPELYDRYWEQIPVVLVDGRPHDYWRVDERRLRQALAAPSDRRRGWFRRGPMRPTG
jgi:glutaredoxin